MSRAKRKLFCSALTLTMLSASISPIFAEEINIGLIGSDRFDTANKIARRYFEKTENVILVNSAAVADALSVAPLAKKINAPVLLTKSDKLDDKTMSLLKEYSPKKLILIGGTSSISKTLEESLKNIVKDTVRIQGKDRFDTSMQIAKNLGVKGDFAFMVNGYAGLPDAASAGACAAKMDIPLVFVDKNIDNFKNTISDLKLKGVYLIGGTNGIPKEFDGVISSERLSGEDRLGTNAKLIERFYKNNVSTVFVAKDGMGNPSELIDSVTIGGAAGKLGAPIVLANKKNGLNAEQKSLFAKLNPTNVVGVGGGNELAGDDIRKILPKANVEIPKLEKPNSGKPAVTPTTGGGGGGGSAAPAPVDYTQLEHLKTAEEVNNELEKLMRRVAEVPAVKEIADFEFNKSTRAATVTIKSLEGLKNLQAISGTNLITGLQDIKKLQAYKVGTLDKRNIQGEDLATLKKNIINDILAELNLGGSSEPLKEIDGKIIKAKAIMKDSKGEFENDYSLTLKLSDELKNSIEENAVHEATTDTFNDKLDRIVSDVASNPDVAKIASMKFDKDSRVTDIVINSLDGDIRKLSNTGFITKIKGLEELVSYKIEGQEEVKASDLSDQQLKASIISGVLKAFDIKESNDILKADGKNLKITAKIRDEKGEFEKDYTFNFSFSDELKKKIAEDARIEAERIADENKRIELEKNISNSGNTSIINAAKEQDASLEKNLKLLKQQHDLKSNDFFLARREDKNIINFGINPEKKDLEIGKTLAATGLKTMGLNIIGTKYVDKIKINDDVEKVNLLVLVDLMSRGQKASEEHLTLEKIIGLNTKVRFHSTTPDKKTFYREFLIKVTEDYNKILESYK